MFQTHLGQQFLSDLKAFCRSLDLSKAPQVEYKADRSQVTEVDRALSLFCKQHPLARGFHFYSEEDHGELQFPALVVDPLDGTREFIMGRGECAVSVAWLKDPQASESLAVIYNPFTGFSLVTGEGPVWQSSPPTHEPVGFISRSEFERGDYRAYQAQLIPRGSIAFKLGLLAAGNSDYVVSFREKNIWDIAAGTLLCWERGFEFFSAGQRVTSFERETYAAPLIWAPPPLMTSLLKTFSS